MKRRMQKIFITLLALFIAGFAMANAYVFDVTNRSPFGTLNLSKLVIKDLTHTGIILDLDSYTIKIDPGNEDQAGGQIRVYEICDENGGNCRKITELYTGSTGVQGPQGPQGPKGDTGAVGAAGVAGAAGASINTGYWNGDDLIFKRDDGFEIRLVNAKNILKGPQGEAGAPGSGGSGGTNANDGALIFYKDSTIYRSFSANTGSSVSVQLTPAGTNGRLCIKSGSDIECYTTGFVTTGQLKNGTLTIKRNGVTGGVFSANTGSNVTVDIDVPVISGSADYICVKNGNNLECSKAQLGIMGGNDGICRYSNGVIDCNYTDQVGNPGNGSTGIYVGGTTGYICTLAGENRINCQENTGNFVYVSATQTIGGTKTFSTSPVVPSKTSAAGNNGTTIATEAQVYAVDQKVGTLSGNVLKITTAGSNSGQYCYSTDGKTLICNKDLSGAITNIFESNSRKNFFKKIVINNFTGTLMTGNNGQICYKNGDMIECKINSGAFATKEEIAAISAIINALTDDDTWQPNTVNQEGYVTAPGKVANKVWKTDSNGNPSWQDDATGSSTWQPNTVNQEGYVTAPGKVANKVWKTDSNGNPSWQDDSNTRTVNSKIQDGYVTAPGTSNANKYRGTDTNGDPGWRTVSAGGSLRNSVAKTIWWPDNGNQYSGSNKSINVLTPKDEQPLYFATDFYHSGAFNFYTYNNTNGAGPRTRITFDQKGLRIGNGAVYSQGAGLSVGGMVTVGVGSATLGTKLVGGQPKTKTPSTITIYATGAIDDDTRHYEIMGTHELAVGTQSGAFVYFTYLTGNLAYDSYKYKSFSIGVNTTDPKATFDINGSLKLGNNCVPATCDKDSVGTIMYYEKNDIGYYVACKRNSSTEFGRYNLLNGNTLKTGQTSVSLPSYNIACNYVIPKPSYVSTGTFYGGYPAAE